MPNNVVKTKKQELLWKKAEAITKQKFGKIEGHYSYVMAIYKNMGGLKEEFIERVRFYLKK